METLKRYVQEIFPQQLKSHGHPVLFVATTSDKEKLSQGLIGLFTYVFQLSVLLLFSLAFLKCFV